MKKKLILFTTVYLIMFCGTFFGYATDITVKQSKAITSEEEIVQRRIDAFNKQQKNECLNYYAENAEYIELLTDSTVIKGKNQISELVCNFDNSEEKITLEISDRIVFGKYVIDSEIIYSGKDILTRSIAITEVVNYKIQNIWYVYLDLDESVPYEQILDSYITGYNNQDADKLKNNFSSDPVYIQFPSFDILCKNSAEIKNRFTDIFRNTPDCKTEIKDKIFLGNFIIYFEQVTGPGKEIRQVIINELDNHLIKRAWIITEDKM